MEEFWFYCELGLDHVLDFSAYDHILFLSALTIPFTFRNWKKVLILATVFTIAHCLSLALSVYEILIFDVRLIEFLIPITIIITALFNLYYAKRQVEEKSILWPILATIFFGLIHGFGFSNYFKMLMAEEEEKLTALFGFATGIELSQIAIILSVLVFAYVSQSLLTVKQHIFILATSILIICITIPILINTFPF
ncbi:MAG: HupE/UreJ family protein [Cellulophaga sp.]